jgi:hypothetical protein
MALIADISRFEQGGWYDGYRRYPFFAERASWLNQVAPPGKILVAGCGWGYLVDELILLGRDVWGIDASAYCVSKSVVSDRILQRSVLVRSDLNATRTAAGIAANGRFAAGVTEDLLPCLTIPEVISALSELRRIITVTALFHIITPGDGNAQPPGRVPDMSWRTQQEWKNIVGNDLIYNSETGSVL